MEEDISTTRKPKESRGAILISDKINFKSKTETRNKESLYIMIKGPIHQDDIKIVNVYAPSITAHKYIKQIPTDVKGETDNNHKNICLGDIRV